MKEIADKAINFTEDIKEGWEYIKTRKDLIFVVIIAVCFNFALGLSVTVPIPYIVNEVFRLSPESFGIIEGGFSIGIIIGAVFIQRIIKKYRLLS